MTKTRCGIYPECESCINREHDPFECDDCEDASNYEPDEDFEPVDVISYEDFKTMFRDTELMAA